MKKESRICHTEKEFKDKLLYTYDKLIGYPNFYSSENFYGNKSIMN